MIVNGKNIQIYNLDTDNTIKKKIASTLKTLPIYIYVKDDTTSNNLEVIDILKLIKKDAKKSNKFESFLKTIRQYITPNINIKKDILHVWIAYNEKIEALQEISPAIITLLGKRLVSQGYFKTIEDFEFLWNERKNIIKKLKEKIKNNKKEVKDNQQLFKSFEMDEGADTTDIEIKEVNINLTLKLENITTMELFNTIVLNQYVPYTSALGYHKILKDFIPNEKWIELTESEMLLMVSPYKEGVLTDINDYSIVNIHFDDDKEKFIFDINVKIGKNYLTVEEFIKRCLNVFKGINTEYTILENKIKGIFYVPNYFIKHVYFFRPNNDTTNILINDKHRRKY